MVKRFIGTAALAGVLAVLAPGAAPAVAQTPDNLPPMVRIKPLMLPVVSTRGMVEKYTQVEVTLELASASSLPDVQGAMPRLHDAILTALYDAVSAGWIVRGNIANAAALRRSLDEAGERLVGKDVISRVLITPVARQSSWP